MLCLHRIKAHDTRLTHVHPKMSSYHFQVKMCQREKKHGTTNGENKEKLVKGNKPSAVRGIRSEDLIEDKVTIVEDATVGKKSSDRERRGQKIKVK